METLLLPLRQKTFLKKLFSWYKKSGRHDMPWRKTQDPYNIFVSEFMLQQTTVATVRPYYDRFLKRFPTITALAQSPLQDVLALWSGLGYYARARNLWAAMQTVEKEHRGKIPHDFETLLKLPGVGPYTAGAVATIAFNRPAVVLDGNIIRVFMRLLAIEDDPKLKDVQLILKKLSLDLARLSAKSVVSGPRHLSLALMDLGATVCTPKSPNCAACPAASFCLAKEFNRQESIPPVGDTLERPRVKRLFAILQHNKKWLLGRRPEEGLFGGLWEFIGVDAPAGIEPVQFLEEAVERETEAVIRVQEALIPFEHQLSHRVYVVRPYFCLFKDESPTRLAKKGGQYEEFRWIRPIDLKRFGLSSITKKIINDVVLNKSRKMRSDQ